MTNNNNSVNLLTELKIDDELKKLSEDLKQTMTTIDNIFDAIEKEIVDEDKRNINR